MAQGGLKRQPTKYPHGLGISVHTVVNEDRLNYSRASTLRSSQKQNTIMATQHNVRPSIEPPFNLIGSTDHLKELQVRRFKYPLTGTYYLDTQDTVRKSSPFDVYAQIKLWCSRRHFRWFIMILACVLLCFGLISYGLWLHNISVARERYRKQQEIMNNNNNYNNNKKLNLPIDASQESVESTTSKKFESFEYDQYSLEHLDIPLENIEEDFDQNSPKTKSSQFQNQPIKNNFARVSPTIPPIPKAQPTPMNFTAHSNAPESRCFSTSLQMCQGVLDYDLTYNSSINLEPSETDAFNALVQSNCSARAIEFICVALQPECRPSHIGALPPCRRVCKAILEACAIVISNTDPLISLFDCNLYPDSNDARKCEDFTRRHPSCYNNEFQCSDGTCIPHQWQCDNIKDCAHDEDETSCLICENQDEFRCRSNDKCVPESMRCDLTNDCFDGSDEENCEEIGSGEESSLDEVSLDSFDRIFSYATFLLPNSTNEEGPYTYVTTTGQGSAKPSATTTLASSPSSAENPIKGFVNFRDSKEIMITSDSENKYKYSSAGNASNHSTSKFAVNTTPIKSSTTATRVANSTKKPLHSACAAHELRCVSGQCITVEQLCDKKMDCPDGADEFMCVYKQRSRITSTPSKLTTNTITSTTTRNISPSSSSSSSSNTTTAATGNSTTATIVSTNADKRTLRTTIKRKVKT